MAVRVVVEGEVDVAAVAEQARALGALGWVRADPDGRGRLHVEGPDDAVERLLDALRDGGHPLEVERARKEGHEQFAVRGVPAGIFVVQEHRATAHHFDLRLEVDGVLRSWAVPKGPSLDPAVKRLAVEVPDHSIGYAGHEAVDHGVLVWDRGTYEQGGRVPWPEAIERGHAVFVLHGEKLAGGFALQRIREGAKPLWLLLKRKDDLARPGSDVVAERPESVVSGRTLPAP